jgi:hypothetical protein
MTTTVRILGSRAREQVPGTSITLLAPGFSGSLTQLATGAAPRTEFDLPFAEAAAGADVMLAAQLNLQLHARMSEGAPGLRSRSAVIGHPRVIVPRRSGVAYALLQTDESGVSSFVAPMAGDQSEVVFPLAIAARGQARRTLRVLMWPETPSAGPGPVAGALRWERQRRPHGLWQWSVNGWQPFDAAALAAGPVLLLLHDTFSTGQSTFTSLLEHQSFRTVAGRYAGRCIAFTHPTLCAGLEENLQWLMLNLAAVSGRFDIVAHGRGGLLARAIAVDGRLPLRRVCQLGTPNQGTTLANEENLARFLDAHVAMLARTPRVAALGTLEGALCLARCVAQGQRPSLPGVEVLTPECAPLRGLADFRSTDLRWYTVGAQFEALDGNEREPPDPPALESPNDGLVPTRGCHEPGITVDDRLELAGHVTHHHNYFASDRVRMALMDWLG